VWPGFITGMDSPVVSPTFCVGGGVRGEAAGDDEVVFFAGLEVGDGNCFRGLAELFAKLQGVIPETPIAYLRKMTAGVTLQL
jgi:hypothetical protein